MRVVKRFARTRTRLVAVTKRLWKQYRGRGRDV